MTATNARVLGAVVGAATMAVAGVLAGAWWWVAALAGALSAVGAVVDRQLVFAQMLAVLALRVGLAVETSVWFVPLLVGGTIASVELGASADRTTIIRSRVPGPVSAATTAAIAVAVSGTVLLIGELPIVAASGSVVVAAAAAALATRVIAR